MKKKLLMLVLVMALAVMLAVPAMAEEPDDPDVPAGPIVLTDECHYNLAMAFIKCTAVFALWVVVVKAAKLCLDIWRSPKDFSDSEEDQP